MNNFKKKNNIILIIFSIFFTFYSILSNADRIENKNQEFPMELSDLPIEELMNVSLEVGTKNSTLFKDIPGIITIIGEKEIKNSGARDLIDVLMQVPGFTFASDVEGVVSLGFRGIWAYEGKVLLLWNGHELNEALYGTVQLGRRYPVDHINRIEVMRGPGSVIYGGFAELAVINIVTKNADDLNGLETTVNYGQMGNTLGGRNLSLSYGKRWDDWSISLQTFYSQGQRSNQTYFDSNGDSYNFSGNSRLNSGLINLDLSYKDLDFKLFSNIYHTLERDGVSKNISVPVQNDFNQTSASLSYRLKISKDLQFKPYLYYSSQAPWRATYPDEVNEQSGIPYDRTVSRTNFGAEFNWNLTSFLSWTAGAELNQYLATTKIPERFYNNLSNISYSDTILLNQIMIQSSIANFTVGLRYINNSIYGSNLVPRAGLTKSIESWNFKLLYSNAYRAPTFENFNTNLNIQPEKTSNIEFEVIKNINKISNISFNIFKLNIKDPIIYTNLNDQDVYLNYKKTGSIGFELQHRVQSKGQYLLTSYSFSSALKNEVDIYSTSDPTQLVGVSKHKFTILANQKILWENLFFSPSIAWLSSKKGNSWDNQNKVFSMVDQPAVLLVNLYFTQKDIVFKDLDLGFGVMNLLDSQYGYTQAYNAIHSPIPGYGREYLTRINYSLSL